jgi:uncharacterized protein (DUF1800 family)
MSRLAPYAGPWTSLQARHLLRRAGFGIPVERVAELAAMGREKAVASFLDPAVRGETIADPDWLPEAIEFEELRRRRRELQEGMDEEKRRQLLNEMDRENRQALVKTALWWLKRMHDSPTVLREKMTLFWHGHFAVSAEKVKQAAVNYDLNKRLRLYALGRFEALVLQVAQSPAMLRYLDNNQNLKSQPNENFARELMELFTLGIGHYTEEDIKEAARAFTGWSSNGVQFTLRRRQHDEGYKVFLGERGNFDGADIIGIIMKRPQVAPFIARKIWEFFAYEAPDDELLAELADRFRRTRYDVADLLSAIFNSAEFYSQKAIWTQIKSPIHFIIGLHGHLKTSTPRPRLVIQMLRLLGQVPFYPPNVKGWDYGRAWINSNTLLLRANIANYLVNGVLPELNDRPGRPGGEERQRFRQARQARQEAMSDMGMMMDSDMIDDGEDDHDDNASPEPKGIQTRPPLDLPALLETLAATSPSDLVEKSINRFIGHAVSPDQRAALLDAVSGVRHIDAPRRMGYQDQNKVRGMLHLLLSAAEYQLC